MDRMIGGLQGNIKERGAGFIILDVGGVGYKIYVTAETYTKLGEEENVYLHTHLVVREDSLTLFGFENHDELYFFEMLIGVSGIGPKSALAILSLTDTKTLASAIIRGEGSYLTKVSGIGRKNAEKIIIELKDKLGNFALSEKEGAHANDVEVLEALEALGYGVRQVRDVLKDIPNDITDTGELLKEALKRLSNH